MKPTSSNKKARLYFLTGLVCTDAESAIDQIDICLSLSKFSVEIYQVVKLLSDQ